MQLNVYKNFFEDIKNGLNYKVFEQYKDSDFIIASISSPSPSKTISFHNELSIFIYFSNIDKQVVLRREYAWESLSRIYLGYIPLREPIESGAWSVSWDEFKGIKKKDNNFVIDEKSFKKFITFKELKEIYGFELWIHQRTETKEIMDETIAVYAYENNIIFIPSIVNIQAFYTKAKANSLFDALANPQGISCMVEKAGYEINSQTKEKEYHVYITGNSHTIDAKMLTYFTYDKDITNQFNACAMDISQGNKIKAKIPKKGKIKFKANYFDRKRNRKNLYFITSILESDLSDDVISKIGNIQLHHPKSYTWAETSSQNKNNNHDTKRDSPSENTLDDSNKVDNQEIPFEVDCNDMFPESTGLIDLEVTIVSAGEREQKTDPKKPKESNKKKLPSSRPPRGGSGDGKPIKNENKREDKKLFALIENSKLNFNTKLILLLQKRIFTVIHKIYKIPLPEGKETGPAFCYVDKEKTKRRNFFLMKASGIYNQKKIDFFYLDLEPKLILKKGESKMSKSNKEILIIISSDDFKTMSTYKINKIINDQVKNGSTKWLKDDEDTLKNDNFFMLRHNHIDSSIDNHVDKLLSTIITKNLYEV